MKFGVSLMNRGPFARPDNMVALARLAEARGFDHVVVSEHIVAPIRPADKDQHRIHHPARDGWRSARDFYEPLVTLGFLAGQTSRVRLGTSVLLVPYRNPVSLAKSLATVDLLSGGRLFVGVGSGWWADEFEALGLGESFRTRGARTDEALRVFKALWGEEVVSFEGRFHQFREVDFSPKPPQGAAIPIWVGGDNPGALRRLVTLGDVWHPSNALDPAAVAARRAEIDRLAEAAGRDPATIGIAMRCPMIVTTAERRPLVGTAEQVAEDVRAYARSGVTHLTVHFRGTELVQVSEQLEQAAEGVLPHFA